MPQSLWTCTVVSVVWREPHFGPWPNCPSSLVEKVSANKWALRGEKKAKSNAYGVNWANTSHFVAWQYNPLWNWHNHVQPLTEGVKSLRREAPNIPHLPHSWLVYLGSKLSQQQYFELDWASLMSYRKILCHRGGIYCIFYTRDRKSRHALEAGEYLSFQSIQRAQQGISRITFSSLAEGLIF